MCGWEYSGCGRGYCRVIRGAPRALNRSVIEGHPMGWLVCISRIFLFDSHIHCFLLLLLLFAFRSCNRKSTEGRSQAPRESSPSPREGSEGTGSSGSGSPALGFGASFADATEGAVFLAVSLVSIRFSSALQKSCQSRCTRSTARVCRYAKTESLCYQKAKTGFHC